MTAAVSARIDVVSDVLAEAERADEKFGPQDALPDVDAVLTGRDGGCTRERMAQEYEIPTASRARWGCHIAASRGTVTWGHVLVEEVAEAIEAATLAQQGKAPAAALREELTQVAAVALRWVEALDRRSQP